MLTDDFDYALPEARIAQRPAARGESRLLVVDAPPAGRHHTVTDLPDLLEPGDLLVVNDTRVIPARLFARRPESGGRVELLLVEKLNSRRWDCMARPGRRLRPGTRLELDEGLTAQVVARRQGGRFGIDFSAAVEPFLERIGHVPLPPYIHRPDEDEDRHLYQTVFAAHPGSIAAPTAGLHFDDNLLDRLALRGVKTAKVTLHVGIGTFKPVTAERIDDHRMESERYSISPDSAEEIRLTRERGGRIVGVGTTVVRTLESAAAVADGSIEAGEGRTELFITPGFRFRALDLLLTNFHLPRSTLLMLVSAFAGRERVLAAYREAIDHEYRFYSYGDAMLLTRR